jgi:hypothetical protein
MRITHTREKWILKAREIYGADTCSLIFVAALTLKKIALNYNELIPSNGSRGIRNLAMRVADIAAATRISNENSHFCTNTHSWQRQGEYTNAYQDMDIASELCWWRRRIFNLIPRMSSNKSTTATFFYRAVKVDWSGSAVMAKYVV